MKKALALSISIFVCVSLFQFFLHFLPQMDYFQFQMGAEEEIFGFVGAIVLYFLIAGNLFYYYLKLEWWKLWCIINFVGYPLSYFVFLCLEPWQEEIDILLLIFFATFSLYIAWGVVGLVFLCSYFICRIGYILKK